MDYDIPKPAVVQQVERPKAAGIARIKDGTGNIAFTQVDRSLTTPQGPTSEKVKILKEYLDQGGYVPSPDRTEEKIHGENSTLTDKLPPEANAPRKERLKRSPVRGKLKLESISDKLLADVVRGLAKELPDLEAKIISHARIRDHFLEAAAPAIPLPTTAPRLWADRPDDERGMNPAAWIRRVYAPWLGQGLARQHIGELDPELGRAYSSWTRKERHPEDTIVFAARVAHNRIMDDKEAIGRRRDSSEKAKLRAKLDTMPQL